MEGDYNKISTTAVVYRTKDTELFHYRKIGLEEGKKLSLTDYFEELDNFFAILETEQQTKSIVMQNSIYNGTLAEYASWLRDTLGEFEVKEKGIDLELDEDKFLMQHEQEMEDLKESIYDQRD